MLPDPEDGFEDEANGVDEHDEADIEDSESDNDAGDDDADQPDRREGGGDELAPGDDDDDQGERQVKPVSRAQARIETALREAKAAREQAEQAKRDLDALRAQSGSREEAERERIALENMDPYERLTYQSQRQAADTKAQIDRLQFQMADSADRTEFASKAARIPALAAVADDVEAALAAMRQGGTTAPRETIAKYLLGERALARGAGAKTRGAKAGAARIERAAGRPTGQRSDVRSESPRGDTREARANRLKDLSI